MPDVQKCLQPRNKTIKAETQTLLDPIIDQRICWQNLLAERASYKEFTFSSTFPNDRTILQLL